MSAGVSKSWESYSIHWIHCNRCGESYLDTRLKFFLLACDHITCETCRIDMKTHYIGRPVFKCSLCFRDVQACEINGAMHQDFKILFHSDPYVDGGVPYRILKFQADHQRRYLESLKREEYITAKKRKLVDSLNEDCKKKFQEYQLLKEERKRLERRVLAIVQQNGKVDDNRF